MPRGERLHRQARRLRRPGAAGTAHGARALSAPTFRQLGALALLSQPAIIVVQLAVAARWEVPFDPTRNTISDLGAVECGTIRAAYGPVEVCSPWHAGMNAGFLVVGALLALGAVLAVPSLASGPATRVAAVRMLVAGVSSAAVGLVPLDVDGDLHTLVATLLFATQPPALLLLGCVATGRGHRRDGLVLLVAGVVAALGAVAFGATLVTGEVGGLHERVALWTCHAGLAVVGWRVLRARGTGPGDRARIWETAA